MTLESFVPAAKSTRLPETQVQEQGAGVCQPCPGRCRCVAHAQSDWIVYIRIKKCELFSLYFSTLSSQKQLANPRLQKICLMKM